MEVIIIKIDLNLTITAIIALTALISPIITAVINNKHDLKKRKMDIYYSQQCEALDEFIKATLNYYGDSNWGQMSKYTTALNNLYIYFNNLDSSLFSKLNDCREKKELIKYKATLNLIVKNLSKQISKI